MLILKRVQYSNDWVRCDVTDEILLYGDYYYQDDTDNLIISAEHYGELKRKRREQEFDYSRLENAKSQAEYRQMLKEYEKSFFASGVLDRKVHGENIY